MKNPINTNHIIQQEMINLYTDEISKLKDEDLINFIKTEKEKIEHIIKMNQGLYKGKSAPSSWNYFTGYSDGMRVSVMKRFQSLMAHHYHQNKTLSLETIEYIDLKISVVYNEVKKLIKKLNKRKDKFSNETSPNQ